MKLDKLAVTWNDYTFANEGILPKSYGGKVVFRDDDGNTTQVTLSAGAIDQIMQVVAIEVANNARRMLGSMTLEAIRDSARPLAITQEPVPTDELLEEADFNDRPF